MQVLRVDFQIDRPWTTCPPQCAGSMYGCLGLSGVVLSWMRGNFSSCDGGCMLADFFFLSKQAWGGVGAS